MSKKAYSDLTLNKWYYWYAAGALVSFVLLSGSKIYGDAPLVSLVAMSAALPAAIIFVGWTASMIGLFVFGVGGGMVKDLSDGSAESKQILAGMGLLLVPIIPAVLLELAPLLLIYYIVLYFALIKSHQGWTTTIILIACILLAMLMTRQQNV